MSQEVAYIRADPVAPTQFDRYLYRWEIARRADGKVLGRGVNLHHTEQDALDEGAAVIRSLVEVAGATCDVRVGYG